MDPTSVKYSHGLKDKMRDRGFYEAVCSIARSVVVGVCVLALFVFVIYVLLALPSLKSESLARFKRLKENASNKACVPPPVTVIQEESPHTNKSDGAVKMCVTPHGVLRCNDTVTEEIMVAVTPVKNNKPDTCDEDTMYYRQIDVEYEARVEALLRLVHMEAQVCGPMCLYWIQEITDGVTNHPPLSVCLLTIALMVFEWSVLDCHKGRKRVRAALDALSTKPPSFLQNEKQD